MKKIFFYTSLFIGIFGNIHWAIAASWQDYPQPIGNLVRLWDTTPGLPIPLQPPIPVPPPPDRVYVAPTTGIGEVNYICAQWDSNVVPETAPFDTGVAATEIIPSQHLHFVRLFSDGGNPYGVWIMRSQYVRGLTPQQLQDRFALPTAPTKIVNVEIPPGTRPLPNGKIVALWTGVAGPIETETANAKYYWGHGGGLQTRIISNFGATYPEFSAYGFPGLPGFREIYYQHIQPIGATALSYQPLSGGGNAGRVASYLDSFIPTAYSDLEEVYTSLDYLNWIGFNPPLPDALNQISPERLDAFSRLETRNSLLFANSLFERNRLLRMSQLGRIDCCDPNACSCRRICPGFWTQGLGEFGDARKEEDLTGFDYQTGGFAVGMDCELCPSLIIGWSGGYLGSYLSWDNEGGSAHIDNARAGIYASYFPGCAFFDAALCYGAEWTHSKRRIAFAEGSLFPIDRTAQGRDRGHDVEALLEGGFDHNFCGWWLTPLARLYYFNVKGDKFHEKGANSLNLFVDDFSAATLRTHLELGVSRIINTPCCFQLIPQIEIAWAHDVPLDDRLIDAYLEEIGSTMKVYGFRKNTDSLIAGGDISLLCEGGVLISGRYDLEIRQHFTAHEVSLNARYTF